MLLIVVTKVNPVSGHCVAEARPMDYSNVTAMLPRGGSGLKGLVVAIAGDRT